MNDGLLRGFMDIAEITVGKAQVCAKNNIVFLKGEFDSFTDHTFLENFFNDVILKMEDEIVLDLSEIIFMSSSMISTLVSFILNRKPGSKVVIRINKFMLWQKISVKVLSRLDPAKISVIENS